jgi:hypothetical protein
MCDRLKNARYEQYKIYVLILVPFLYLRLSADGASAPKHVGVFKGYVHFVNLLCEFVGEYD